MRPFIPRVRKRLRRKSSTWASDTSIAAIPSPAIVKVANHRLADQAHLACLSFFSFDIFATDENSPVPLTLSFQHVQFNKGGARSASFRGGLRSVLACN